MTTRRLKRLLIQCFFIPLFSFFCFFPNTLARWLFFTENSNKPPPPYQFTLFGSFIYGLSGVFNLILFLLTRPKIVVGRSVGLTKESAALPSHSRHDSQKRSDFYYEPGPLSIDIENSGRHSSLTYEIQNPSRTIHRIRPSYDLQGVSPSSLSRNVHWASSELPVLDIS